jgi:hypothetical protein
VYMRKGHEVNAYSDDRIIQDRTKYIVDSS